MSSAAPDVLILAAGCGLRLGALSRAKPKCLVEVGGEAPLDRWSRLLESLPATDITVNTHHLAEQVDKRLSRYMTAGPHRWRALHEPTLLGSAGTLRRWIEGVTRENILVIYADNISDLDPWEFVRNSRSGGWPITLGLFRAPDRRSCGLAICDADGRIVGFEEKPAKPSTDLAFAGIFAAEVTALRPFLRERHRDIGSDLLPDLIGHAGGLELGCYHRDMGTAAAIAAIERDAADGLWHPHGQGL
jgi:NDP-sugar pyrophosphorylase family protein